MFWAINGGTTEFDPPNIIGNFSISIDENCQIDGGNGFSLVGHDFHNHELEHKTMKGIIYLGAFYLTVALYYTVKYISKKCYPRRWVLHWSLGATLGFECWCYPSLWVQW